VYRIPRKIGLYAYVSDTVKTKRYEGNGVKNNLVG